MDENKKKALASTITSLEKQYGKGVVMRLGDQPALKIESFSSGSISLDEALGIGGYPKGRVIEVYGPESSGKTTLTLHAIAEVQKTGGTCAFIDAEHALDTIYAKNIGVDIENLYISQPSDGEQALEIMDELICSAAIDLIVVDSVAALVPRAEIEGHMGDAQMALQARLMSQALRKVTGSISKTNTSVMFVNQLRMKIGIMFGNPETTTGGNALKFYTSIRLDVRKVENIKKGEELIGSRLKVKVVKNKVAPPFRLAFLEVYYGSGISPYAEVLDLAVKYNIIQKSGSWFSYHNERLAQGAENVKQQLKDNKNLFEQIKSQVLQAGNVYKDAQSNKEDAQSNKVTLTNITTKKDGSINH